MTSDRLRVEPARATVVTATGGAPPARSVEGGWIASGPALSVDHPGRVERFYRHGWHSFSCTRWVDASSPVPFVPVEELRIGGDDPVHAFSDRHGGSAVGAVEGAPGASSCCWGRSTSAGGSSSPATR